MVTVSRVGAAWWSPSPRTTGCHSWPCVPHASWQRRARRTGAASRCGLGLSRLRFAPLQHAALNQHADVRRSTSASTANFIDLLGPADSIGAAMRRGRGRAGRSLSGGPGSSTRARLRRAGGTQDADLYVVYRPESRYYVLVVCTRIMCSRQPDEITSGARENRQGYARIPFENKKLSGSAYRTFCARPVGPRLNPERPHAAFGTATLRSTTNLALVLCSPPPVTAWPNVWTRSQTAATRRLRR